MADIYIVDIDDVTIIVHIILVRHNLFGDNLNIFDALEKSLKKHDFEGVTLAFTALRYFAIVQKKLKIDVEKILDGIAAVME